MTSTGLANVKAGDTLILVENSRYRDDQLVTVSRIGRKWLYVAVNGYEQRSRFDINTGAADGNHGIPPQLYTPEQQAERKQRATLLKDLLSAGVEIRYQTSNSLTTAQLRAVLDIVNPVTNGN